MLKQESSAFSGPNSWQVPAGAEHPVQADQWTKYIPCLFVGAYLAIHLTINAPILALGVCLSSAVWMVGRNTFLKDRNLQPLAAPVLTILFAFAVWTGAATHAHALFFGAAETFFQSTFPTAAAVTPMVFGVLRAIFLLYIAISLIRVINGVRQDEDWQTIARAPLMVAMSVAVADILTTLVSFRDPPDLLTQVNQAAKISTCAMMFTYWIKVFRWFQRLFTVINSAYLLNRQEQNPIIYRGFRAASI